MNLVIKLGYETYALTVPESVVGIVSSALLTAQDVVDPYEATPTVRPLSAPPEVKIIKAIKVEGVDNDS